MGAKNGWLPSNHRKTAMLDLLGWAILGPVVVIGLLWLFGEVALVFLGLGVVYYVCG